MWLYTVPSRKICYAFRFCLRMQIIHFNVSQMKDVFSCSKNEKRNSPFCHLAWPWRSKRLSGMLCMESFIWVVVYLFFLFVLTSISGWNCAFCSEYTVFTGMWSYYAQHGCMHICFRLGFSSLPVMWRWISPICFSMLARGVGSTASVQCHVQSTAA